MAGPKREPIANGAVPQDHPVMVEADYLVVGAGAAGMAFVDALINNADVQVAVVDRRHSAGGHWLDAYPFVRLHQIRAMAIMQRRVRDRHLGVRGGWSV